MSRDDGKQNDLDQAWRSYKQENDARARDRLILAYSPLVKYVAGRMSSGLPAHIEEGDLVSYGLLGLIGALERFDLSRNIKFETYAVSRIKGAIIDELRALDWVPRSVRSWARKVEAAVTQLENELSRAPSDDETASQAKHKHRRVPGRAQPDQLCLDSRARRVLGFDRIGSRQGQSDRHHRGH